MKKKKIQNIKIIYNLSKLLYEQLFDNVDFWLSYTEYVNNNGIHDYFIDDDLFRQKQEEINNKWNDIVNGYILSEQQTQKQENQNMWNYFYNIFSSSSSSDKIQETIMRLSNYFKTVIFGIVFTNQYNYNYGLPETYNNIKDLNYKFKVIPYNGVNSPVYGSEFSDIILSYVLTYITYRLLLKTHRLRKIDKLFMMESIIYNIENEIDEEKNMHLFQNMFEEKIPETILKYTNNKMFYDEYINPDCVIELEDFNEHLIAILEKNIEYSEKCKNISFTDLLLHNNIKNYIAFTGTTYMNLPKDIITYKDDKQIEQSKITIQQIIDGVSTIFEKTVSETIETIIQDNNINKLFRINNNEHFGNLVEQIFQCLYNYDVLIDIGGYILHLDDNAFIHKYVSDVYLKNKDNKTVQKPKRYLYYFDNGPKIYDCVENKKMLNYNDSYKEDTFFYFSNKHITGVDAKKYMKPDVYGLVTISSNTTIRDFSQGIYRIRTINDYVGAKIDIVMNDKMYNYLNKTKDLEQIGGNLIKKNIKRNILINIFKENQQKQQEIKNTLLYKQNIIGLVKSVLEKNKLNMNEIYLYIDPSIITSEITINNKNINMFNNKLPKKSIFTTFIKSYTNTENITKLLVDNLFSEYQKNNIQTYSLITTNRIQQQEQQKQQKQQKQQEINKNLTISTFHYDPFQINVDNFTPTKTHYFITKSQSMYNIILYKIDTEQGLVLNTYLFIKFIITMNEEQLQHFYNNYIVFSIHNNICFSENYDTSIINTHYALVNILQSTPSSDIIQVANTIVDKNISYINQNKDAINNIIQHLTK